MLPSEDDVHAWVQAAIDALCSRDMHLLDADASERSLTHQLAIHLARHFPDHHVDCEYNRDGFSVKKLKLTARRVNADSLDAVTVFPDIIVHVRGCQDRNLLVVEMKKPSSLVNHDYDIQKLRAFKNELNYTFAVHLVLGYGKDGKFIRQTNWQ